MSKPKVDHIARAQLPWRRGEDEYTECGLPVEAHPVLTRTEFVKRIKDLGQERAAMVTCMTCFHTVQRWGRSAPEDGDDLRTVMRREIEWEGDGRWAGYLAERRPPRLRDELRAITMLIERHREEFDGLVVGLGNAADIRVARAAKKQRRDETKPKGL